MVNENNTSDSEKFVMSHEMSSSNIWHIYKSRMNAMDDEEFSLVECDVGESVLVIKNGVELKTAHFLLRLFFMEQTKLSNFITTHLGDAASRSFMGLLLNNISIKIGWLSSITSSDFSDDIDIDLNSYEIDDLAKYLFLFKLNFILPNIKVLKKRFDNHKALKNLYMIELRDIAALVSFLKNTKYNVEFNQYKHNNVKLGHILGNVNIDKFVNFYLNKVKGIVYFPTEVSYDEDFDLNVIDKQESPIHLAKLKKETNKFSLDADF